MKSLFGISIRNIKSNRSIMLNVFISIILSLVVCISTISFLTSIADALFNDVRERVGGEFSSIQIFAYIFAGIALIACAFMVSTSFRFFIDNNKKQFSIMRTFGTSGAQLAKILFMQGALIIVSGAILGLLLSLLIHSLVFEGLSLLLGIVVVVSFDFITAIIITSVFSIAILLSLLFPIIQCTRILPLQVKIDEDTVYVNKKWKNILGIVFLGISVLLFAISLIETFRASDSGGPIIASVIFFIPGFNMLFPNLIHKSLTTLLSFFKKSQPE